MVYFLLLIPSLLVGAILYYYYLCYSYMKNLKRIPGPIPLPILGNALEFKSRNTTLSTFSNLFKRYGKLVKIMLADKPVVVIADYKAMQAVLSSNKVLEKSMFYRFLHPWLNFGLLTSSEDKWKHRRRMLTPTYHFQILEQFMPIFNRNTDILIEEFKKEKNKDSVDVYPYITLHTLDVICETAMGVTVDAQKKKNSSYVWSVKQMGRIFMDRSFLPHQQFTLTYRFTKNYQTEKECLRILHGYTDSVITSRRAELSHTQANDVKRGDELYNKKRVAFLDMLLSYVDDNGVPLSDADIREEVDTFMFEGHDTTAAGISFALFEIANNPAIQLKIRNEQNEIFRGETRDITHNDLNQMKYLEMVIKETLRLYPPVPIFGRQTTEPMTIKDDIIVPGGISLTLVAYQIHRDPDYFPEPNKFNPDRFLPGNNFGKMPYSFIPFSAGPRNCIGQKFALLEMKVTLSKMIQHFELMPTMLEHVLDLSSEAVLKSNNGMLIKIRERA